MGDRTDTVIWSSGYDIIATTLSSKTPSPLLADVAKVIGKGAQSRSVTHTSGATFTVSRSNTALSLSVAALRPLGQLADGHRAEVTAQRLATTVYGMGADQILEAEAVLADGRIVTANACQHQDLYKALRGGGPGYAVALGFAMKAHPNVPVIAVQRLEVVPVGGNTSALLDAVAVIFQQYLAMNEAGFAGYGYWYLDRFQPIFGNTSIRYYHNFWNIGKTGKQAKKLLHRCEPHWRSFKTKSPSMKRTRSILTTGPYATRSPDSTTPSATKLH